VRPWENERVVLYLQELLDEVALSRGGEGVVCGFARVQLVRHGHAVALREVAQQTLQEVPLRGELA
jgi:hypothetical protein